MTTILEEQEKELFTKLQQKLQQDNPDLGVTVENDTSLPVQDKRYVVVENIIWSCSKCTRGFRTSYLAKPKQCPWCGNAKLNRLNED